MAILGNKFLVWIVILLSSLCLGTYYLYDVNSQQWEALEAGSTYKIGKIYITSEHNIVTICYTLETGERMYSSSKTYWTWDSINGLYIFTKDWPPGPGWVISSDYPVIWTTEGTFPPFSYPVEYYNLGVSVPTGGGSIVNVNEGETVTSDIWEYESGTDVDLAALPSLGWSFHSWLIDGSATSTSETLRLTMDDDHVVEARFTDDLNPVDPDNPSREIKRSELWGSYEKDSDDDYWKEWTLKGSNIADIIETGGEYGVYYGDHLVGYMEEDETVHILMPLHDERYWISKGGQAIGYIDGSSIYLGNRHFGHLAGSINVDGTGTFLGQAAEISFSNKKYGTLKFFDEYGEVMINITDRFWEGYWIPDDPLYDPEDPETYPDEPEWKNIPDEPDEPGIFDEIFQDIKRFIAGFIREYFLPSQDLLEFHASELKRKASNKFPFNLFWIPEKLQGEYEDVDIPLLDLSMFGVDDFKVDWFNNEYMEQAAKWMRNFSRYLLWFMFILWLRDNITPTLVID